MKTHTHTHISNNFERRRRRPKRTISCYCSKIRKNLSTNGSHILRWTPIDPNGRIFSKRKTTEFFHRLIARRRLTLYRFEIQRLNIHHDLRLVHRQYFEFASSQSSSLFPLVISNENSFLKITIQLLFFSYLY